MGNTCEDCNSMHMCVEELTVYLKNDEQAGKLLKLTISQKQKAWSDIKKTYFQVDTFNPIYPRPKDTKNGFIYYPTKSLYEGEMDGVSMHGRGRLIMIDRHLIFKGQFSNNLIDGEGILQNIFEGWLVSGKWTKGFPSIITLKERNETSYIQFKDNSTNQGMIKFADGRRYEGEFSFSVEDKSTVISGKGRMVYSSGDYIEGTFVNGYLQGMGLFFSERTNTKYEGNFVKGLFEGQGTMYFNSGESLCIEWKANKPHGPGRLKIDDKIYTVHYDEGVRSLLQSDIFQP